MLKRDKKQLTLVSRIMLGLEKADTFYGQVVGMGSMRRAANPVAALYYDRVQYERAVNYLKKKGLVKYEYRRAKKIIKLTQKGELEKLLLKTKIAEKQSLKWDSKWRVIIFDIPEHARSVRNKMYRVFEENKVN